MSRGDNADFAKKCSAASEASRQPDKRTQAKAAHSDQNQFLDCFGRKLLEIDAPRASADLVKDIQTNQHKLCFGMFFL